MDGKMIITYRVLCNSDFSEKISLSNLLENEKIQKVIKAEFAKGIRNITLHTKDEASLLIETIKTLYTLEVNKDDFADLLTLAEEDANSKKILKKECSRVELVNIETI